MVNQPIGNHGLGIFWCGQIFRFDFSSLFQGQTRIAKLRSAYMWSDLTLDLKIKREQSNLKVLITRLLLVVQVWDVKPT